jgi:hypothetical protein
MLKGLMLDDTLMIFIATWELYEVNDNSWHLKCCLVAFARGERITHNWRYANLFSFFIFDEEKVSA